ncbi:MAG: hypothetical protein LBP40_06600, partial [Campylobacteraceae bacterium]|nr:hypothetical protein [Campylobacteraceae bacterium]
MNNITNDITKMTLSIIQAGYDIRDGLNNGNISLLEKAIEQLAAIDININKIDNKIISLVPLFGKNENSAREIVSYFRIVGECVQAARVLRCFCKYIITYTNGRPFVITKEYVIQILQLSIETLAMSLKLVEKQGFAEDIFRQIKIKNAAGQDVFVKLEKKITEIDVKYALNCARVLNAADKLDEVFKA